MGKVIPIQIFTLTCKNGSVSVNKSVTIAKSATPPAPAVITDFHIVPASISVGGDITFFWTSTGATECSIPQLSVKLGPTSPASGTLLGPINETTDFVLTCKGQSGSDSKHFTVIVGAVAPPPPPSTPPGGPTLPPPAPTVPACSFVVLSLTETSSQLGASNSNVQFTLDGASRVSDDYTGDVFPYDPEWGADYVLKTLKADKTVIGSYNLFSGRYINIENFTRPSYSRTEEIDQASYNFPIPFDSLVGFIQIDDRAPMLVNATTLKCN